MPKGVLEVYDDVGRIEQNNQVSSKMCDSINPYILMVQKHRPAFNNRKLRSHDHKLGISQLRRRAYVRNLASSDYFRYRGAHDFRQGDLVTKRLENIAVYRRLDENASHPLQALLEHGEQGVRPDLVEQRNDRKRLLTLRLVG